jgi:hypothetical protein
MMRCPQHQEENIPLVERVFVLEGRISKPTIERIKVKFPSTLERRKNALDEQSFRALSDALNSYLALSESETQVYAAASFAYADISVGKLFDVVFPANRVEIGVRCRSILKAVIAEWIPLVMDEVSCGHRSICLFDFPEGVPSMISEMVEVEQFMQTGLEEFRYLCNEPTWQALLERDGARA